MRVIKCIKCGTEVKTTSGNRKYCDKCVKETDKQHTNNFRKINREKVNKEGIERYYKKREIIIEKTKQRRLRQPLESKIRSETYRKYDSERTGICSLCKEKRRTDFHHISYKPNVFIEVCRSCHKNIHFGNIKIGKELCE
jgi:hypothetical protein